MDKTRVLLADDHAVVRAGIGKALGELDNLEIIEEVGIARAMSISVKMVENHLTRLYRQLGVSSRLEAMAYVVAHPEVLAVTGKAAQADQNCREQPRAHRKVNAPMMSTSISPNAATAIQEKARRILKRLTG